MPIEFACPHCQHQFSIGDQYAGQSGNCAKCHQPFTVPGSMAPPNKFAEPSNAESPYAASPNASPPQNIGDDLGMRMLLPVGRSGWAIAAGYFGLFSVLFFPAPIALFLGIMAIRDIRRNPKRHGMGRAIFGLVMGIVFSVFLVMGVVSIVAVQ